MLKERARGLRAPYVFAIGALLLGAVEARAAEATTAAESGAVIRARGAPVDVVFVLGDARASLATSRARLERKRGIDVVDRALATDPATSNDPLSVYGRFLDAAQPTGAVPMSLAMGAGDASWAVLSVRASEGAIERLLGAELVPGLAITEAGEGRLHFGPEGAPVWGALDGDWLRIWVGPPESGVEATGFSPGAFAEGLAEGGQGYLYYDGNGALGQKLRAEATDSTDRLLAGLRRLVFAFGVTGERSSWGKLAVEHPQLAALSPLLAAGAAEQRTLALWGSEASAMLDLALPAPLLQQVLLALEALPASLRELVPKLDGRIGLATFGGLEDWGVAVGTKTPEAAAEAVPALREGLLALARDELPGLEGAFAEVRPGVLALRAHPEHTGLRIRAVGDQVVLSAQAERAFPAKDEQLVLPPVQNLLAKASLLSGYIRPASDPAILGLYAWGGAALGWSGELLEELPPELRDLAAAALAEWPEALRLARAQALFIYDMAFSVEVGGAFLVVEMATTEL